MDLNDFLKLANQQQDQISVESLAADPKAMFPATEKMFYNQFLRNFTVFRVSQIPNHLVDITELQLPNMSALHMVGHFLDPANKETIAPDLENPFIRNEDFLQYLKFVTIPANKESAPFSVSDRFTYSEARYINQGRAFLAQHKKFRPVMTLSSIIDRPNILVSFEYNALLRPIMNGRLILFRKFDLILKTMLNNISALPGRHHYIYFPVSHHVYSRSVYQRTFKKIDTSTVRVQDDMTFYLMIHLMGFVSGPDKSDTSLFNQLSEDVLARTNLVLTRNGQAIIYNLGDLKKWRDESNVLDVRVLRHVAKLQLVEDPLVAEGGLDNVTDDNFENVIKDRIRSEDDPAAALPPVSSQSDADTSEDENAEDDDVAALPAEPKSDRKPIAPSSPLPTYKKSTTTSSLVEDSLAQLDKAMDADPQYTEEHRTKAAVLLERHMNAVIGGRPISELVSDAPLPEVKDNHLDFLENNLLDKSMSTSTIASFDRIYAEDVIHRDVASVLTSFTSKGYFVSNVTERDEVTQLDRIRHYHVEMVDVTGKRHNLVFKLPLVDKDGTVMINGVTSRMVKQQVNVPICKLDAFRVNLSSNYNKQLIERTRLRANNFQNWISSYLGSLKKKNLAEIRYGESTTNLHLPYEYQIVGKNFRAISVGDARFHFDFHHRFDAIVAKRAASTPQAQESAEQPADLVEHENNYGVLFGYDVISGDMFFMNMSSVVFVTNSKGKFIRRTNFAGLVGSYAGEDNGPPQMLSEWTEMKIQDKSFPLVFVLGYRFGLKTILTDMGAQYHFVNKEEGGKRYPEQDEIMVEFADGRLFFSRYPFEHSLIMSGLNRFSLKAYTFDAMDIPDTYFNLLQDNDIQTNRLKGITSFFELFMDPITRDILKRMGEPTTVRGLLMRATEMLATTEAIEASSMRNHRIRGYERLPATIYNVVAREIAAHDARRGGKKRALSINPNAVFLKVIGDSTFNLVDEINPVHEIKSTNAFTYSGSGGRTAQSFVMRDRKYPEDGIGIMSESTPDSGKVALNAFTSADPFIKDIRGMYDVEAIDKSKITPAQLLSVPALLLPGSTQDDAKRTGYSSIQLTHHVPSEYSEVSRIRTGYEEVLAHRVGKNFAVAAENDGVVTEIDDETKTIRIKYKDKPMPTKGKFPYPLTSVGNIDKHFISRESVYIAVPGSIASQFKTGDVYSWNSRGNFQISETIPFTDITKLPNYNTLTPKMRSDWESRLASGQEKAIYYVRLDPTGVMMSGDEDVVRYGDIYTSVSGSHVRQTLVPNVAIGEKVKRGDILVYNKGFFRPHLDDKQVSWAHGIMANIALMEVSGTLEDAAVITQEFANKLVTPPGHLRTIAITNNTNIVEMVKIGDHVQTTDQLAVVEDADFSALALADDPDVVDLLNELGRTSPRAKYHGYIADIDVTYSCDIETMHPSVRALVEEVESKKRKVNDKYQGSLSEMSVTPLGKIPPGSKYRGVSFEENTVLISIMISEDLGFTAGSKLVVASQLKGTVSRIEQKPITTQSGVRVDMLFGASGFFNRMVPSGFIQGLGIRIMAELEDQVVKDYFG